MVSHSIDDHKSSGALKILLLQLILIFIICHPAYSQTANNSYEKSQPISSEAEKNTDPVKPGANIIGPFNWQDLILIFVVTLLVLILLTMMTNIFYHRAALNYRSKEFEKNKNNLPVLAKTDAASNLKEIDNLRKRLTGLEDKFNKLNNQINKSKIPAMDKEPIILAEKQPEPGEPEFKKEQISEVVYLSNPNKNGSFNTKSAHDTFKEGASIYVFTKLSPLLYEFQIDEREDSMKRALEFPDINIMPACEAKNAFNPNARRIITIEGGMGQAELDGDCWKVTRKALIKYEC